MANTNVNNTDFVKNFVDNIDWKKVRTGTLIVGGVLSLIGAFAAGKVSEQQINESTKKNVKEYFESLAKEAANTHHETNMIT